MPRGGRAAESFAQHPHHHRRTLSDKEEEEEDEGAPSRAGREAGDEAVNEAAVRVRDDAGYANTTTSHADNMSNIQKSNRITDKGNRIRSDKKSSQSCSHVGATTRLHAMLPISLSTALLGGVVQVPTLSGRAPLHIPPCVRNGAVLTMTLSRPDASSLSSSSSFSATSSCSDSQTQGAGNEPAVLCVLCFHVLILIPHAQRLTGRQKGALRRYEEEGQEAGSETEMTAVCSESVRRGVGDAAQPVSPCVGVAEELNEGVWKRCAELKNQYRHWFSSP